MAAINPKDIRNVAIIGHSGEGKTSLAEALLFNGKSTDRLGKTTDKNTVMDYDPEEMNRGISISLACAYTTWQNTKINIVDVPGFFDFEGEFEEAMRAVGSAILVADANASVSVGAEKGVDYCIKNHIPLIIFINGVDKENANYTKTVEAFQEKYGKKIDSIHTPILKGGKMVGYASVISGKAYEFKPGGRTEIPVPADIAEELPTLKEMLMEAAAETDEELMEKFFGEGELSDEEIVTGIRNGLCAGDTIPVMGGSATQNIGIINLLNEIVALMPSPLDRKPVKATEADSGKAIEVACDPNAPFSAQVFKTIVDPFVGKLNIMRVFTGSLKSGMTVRNTSSDKDERISSLYFLKGKKQDPTEEIGAGDIGAVSKLAATKTGDTLCDSARKVVFDPIPTPEPVLTLAVSAKKSDDDDKVFQGLSRLQDEDISFRVDKVPETGQMVIRGMGETQLDILCKKLKAKFGCEAVLDEPRIPYRETILGRAEAEGKHKKQTGGAGQFGQVNIRYEPGAADGQFEFVDATVGGSVPKQFIPAVEKGLREAIKEGVLAGYPMENLKCTLFDGKYHPVDSKEIAFISAAKLSYNEGIRKANPVILEPIYSYSIRVPESYMGDIMGDMNKRRGRIMGMNAEGGIELIEAEAPMAEMLKYSVDLRSMTQGRGSFTAKFVRYEAVPAMIQEKLVTK